MLATAVVWLLPTVVIARDRDRDELRRRQPVIRRPNTKNILKDDEWSPFDQDILSEKNALKPECKCVTVRR